MRQSSKRFEDSDMRNSRTDPMLRTQKPSRGVPKTTLKLYLGVGILAGKSPPLEILLENSGSYFFGNECLGISSAEILEIVPKRH